MTAWKKKILRSNTKGELKKSQLSLILGRLASNHEWFQIQICNEDRGDGRFGVKEANMGLKNATDLYQKNLDGLILTLS